MQPEVQATLYDIRCAIDFIKQHARGKSKEDYLGDNLLSAAIERKFITIGEAMTRLRDRHPEVFARISDANEIVKFRNFLVHAYDYVRDERVWIIVEKHLPTLDADIQALWDSAA
jgi:uncharacterized protein with HEPN domain